MGDARALLAGGAVIGGATALGATQAAMISVMAYRIFACPPNAPKSRADTTLAIGYRIAKHLLVVSGRSTSAVGAAETIVSIYMGLRTLRDNLPRMRRQRLLPPPPQEDS